MTTAEEHNTTGVSPTDDRDPQPARGWKRMPSKWTLLRVALIVALLYALAWSCNRPTAIESAGEKCKQTLSVSKDGNSMSLHVWGTNPATKDIFTFAKIEDVNCVLDALEAPDFVRSHIGSTRALDGQQTDDWGDVTARWTYHPEEGLHLLLRTN